jgi:NTE family protein
MSSTRTVSPAAAYQQKVLVLQGGGALGAYQAGAYQALAEAHIEPDWVAGISIGAINAAIIAGNEPQDRVAKLTSFWQTIGVEFPMDSIMPKHLSSGREFKQASSLWSIMLGVPGFFTPRFPVPWLQKYGSDEAASFYDTHQLKQTLLRFVDFDRINEGKTRLSVGAVDVESGNFRYFDNQEPGRTWTFGPEHVMASGALPPGFPSIEIDGRHYWDGGLVSNTPLQQVLIRGAAVDTVVFQVDLFNSHGEIPGNLEEVEERRKDITYSSRTRMITDAFLERHKLRRSIATLLEKLPADALDGEERDELSGMSADYSVTLIHLIHRSKNRAIHSKDYEFSRVSMHQHWEAGIEDGRKALKAEDWRIPPDALDGLAVYDIDRPISLQDWQ